MSSIVIVTIKSISSNQRIKLSADLHSLAHNNGFGIWIANRYVESFEVQHYSNRAFIFSLADDYEFDNCERLVSGWWEDNCSETLFKTHIEYISKTLACCLQYSSSVELFIGSSGDQYEEFDECIIKLSNLYHIIRQKYIDHAKRHVPPSVHFIVS